MKALRITGLVIGILIGIAILALAFRDPAQVPPYAYVLFLLIMATGLITHRTVERRRRSI